MGSRKNWPKELADRCNAVGWHAGIQKSGHYRAFLPDGRSFGWAASTSDTNGYKNAQREAARMGLDQLEQELALLREKERLERIEADRTQNGVPEELMLAPELKEDPNVTKYGTIEVDGVKIGIAEISKPVRHRHPRGGGVHELAHCRELLLVDETIRYQCLKLVAGDLQEVCARHFKTSAGLIVHWNRGSHADDARTSVPQERDLGGVLPAEPKPEERPGPSTYEIIVDRTPSKITTEPDTRSKPKEEKLVEEAQPIAVEQPGVMARMEDLGQQLLDVHFEAQRLANHAQDLHQALATLAEDVHREIASDEVREKAQKFDAMMKAVGQ
jgi:hypothetical protein